LQRAGTGLRLLQQQKVSALFKRDVACGGSRFDKQVMVFGGADGVAVAVEDQQRCLQRR
jgi:hypothetical protein